MKGDQADAICIKELIELRLGARFGEVMLKLSLLTRDPPLRNAVFLSRNAVGTLLVCYREKNCMAATRRVTAEASGNFFLLHFNMFPDRQRSKQPGRPASGRHFVIIIA